jgi:hypothetical protein
LNYASVTEHLVHEPRYGIEPYAYGFEANLEEDVLF